MKSPAVHNGSKPGKSGKSSKPVIPGSSSAHMKQIRDLEAGLRDLAIDPDAAPSNNPVHIVVGPQKKDFEFSQAQLEEKVPFFAKCFRDGGFAESETRTVHLPDDDPAMMSALLHWVVHDKILEPSLGYQTKYEHPLHHGMSRLFTGDGEKSLIYLSRLWVMADKLCCNQLQDEVIIYMADNFLTEKYAFDALHAPELPCRISQTVVEYVYGQTSPGSRLRRMLAQCCAYSIERFDVQVHHLHSSSLEEDYSEWLTRVWRLVIQYLQTPGGGTLTIAEFDAMPENSLEDVLHEWLGELGEVLRIRGQKLALMSFPTDYPDFVNSFELTLVPVTQIILACGHMMKLMADAISEAMAAYLSKALSEAMAKVYYFIEKQLWPITESCKEELWNYISFQFKDDEGFRMYPAKECFKRFAYEFLSNVRDDSALFAAEMTDANDRWTALTDCVNFYQYLAPKHFPSSTFREVVEYPPHCALLPTAEAAGRRWKRVKPF